MLPSSTLLALRHTLLYFKSSFKSQTYIKSVNIVYLSRDRVEAVDQR